MEDCVNPEFFEELQRVVVSTKGDGTSSVEDAHGARITHCERKDCGQLDHWRHHRSRQPKKNSFDKHLLVRSGDRGRFEMLGRRDNGIAR